MPKGDATYPTMTIDECLAFADKWSRGMTIHAGSQGWRVVCMLLAEEVRVMRQSLPDDFSESQEWREGSTVDRVDWLMALYRTALQEIEKLERGEYICKKCGLRNNSS